MLVGTDVSRGDVKGWSKAYMPRIDSDRGRASHRSGDYESGREPHNSTIRMMSPAVGIDDPETYERDLEYFENQGRFSPPSNERLGSEDSQEVRRNHPIAQNRRILTQDSNRRRKYSKSEEHGCCVIL